MHNFRPILQPLWWIYIALVALGNVRAVTAGGIDTPVDVLFTLFAAFGLVPIVGYVAQIKIGWRLLWMTYLIGTIAVLFAILVTFFTHDVRPDPGAFIAFGIAGVLAVPALWAQVAYVIFSGNIWAGQQGVET